MRHLLSLTRSVISDLSRWLIFALAASTLIPEIPWPTLMSLWLAGLTGHIITRHRLFLHCPILTAAIFSLLLLFLLPLPLSKLPPLFHLAALMGLWAISLLLLTLVFFPLAKKLDTKTK